MRVNSRQLSQRPTDPGGQRCESSASSETDPGGRYWHRLFGSGSGSGSGEENQRLAHTDSGLCGCEGRVPVFWAVLGLS